MARDNIQDRQFSFLQAHIAREPHIFEILNEIMAYQNQAISTGFGHFATLDALKTSRNIKIPFTYSRNKTVANLVDIVEKNHPEQMKTLITFLFAVEPETRKLSIIENKEYTLLLKNDEFNALQVERNRQSAENFLTLISQFRLFNLTKLLKKAKERSLLSQIIKSELGKNAFTFKNYHVDKQSIETTEDFCFHINNYNSVKSTLNTEKIKEIISAQAAQINRRLKRFGILSNDFSEYKDTKLDYLLNILLEDISSSLAETDLTEVKNFSSLRSCLLQVEKIIDPLITSSNDIAAYVKENSIASLVLLTSIFSELSEEKLSKWAAEQAARHKILFYKDQDDTAYLIDGETLLPRFTELHNTILNQQGDAGSLSYSEKEKMFLEYTILCNAGKNLLESGKTLHDFTLKEEDEAKLRQLIQEYDDYQKSIAVDSMIAKEVRALKKRKSIFSAITDFLYGLFSFRKSGAVLSGAGDEYSALSQRASKTPVSNELKSIIYRIKNAQGKIAPLSNYIELLPANESNIDVLINDIRKLNIKIIIPIYNARKTLYPKKSQQYLLPDVEYLLVEPEVIQSAESIREFTDSLAGEKIKDEKLSPMAIFSIEKYLMDIHKQKKLAGIKKGKPKK
jgi:hypothetical protein